MKRIGLNQIPGSDPGACSNCGGWRKAGMPHTCTTQGALTKRMLDDTFTAIAKQGIVPRHDCRFDGHVMQWNPLGFHWCIYCHTSEAEAERPTDDLNNAA